jgi:hypothetical protein
VFRYSLKEMMPFSLHFGKAQVSRTTLALASMRLNNSHK